MHARLAANFAKLWSVVATEPPLWEGGGRWASRKSSKHQTLRVVEIPPPSQSGGSVATALQSAAHEMNDVRLRMTVHTSAPETHPPARARCSTPPSCRWRRCVRD